MKSRLFQHEYWKHPPEKNAPEHYLMPGKIRRSRALMEIFQALRVAKKDTILEIGCNAGRNLRFLWDEGYRQLYGIEINPEAIDLMVRENPEMQVNVAAGPVEELLEGFPTVDVIFTMAVLMHIHPESKFVFDLMVKKARKFIIVIENELFTGNRCQKRNYQEVFEGLGMHQIHYSTGLPGFNSSYCARAFTHVGGSDGEKMDQESNQETGSFSGES
jgi:SAM-dependent methyltransferase